MKVNILRIRELKWTEMGEFNSDGHYIYYYEQKSVRRNRVTIIVNKRVEMQYLDVISKMTEWSWIERWLCDTGASTSKWQ